MTEKKTAKHASEKTDEITTVTLDRDMQVAGEDKKKGDKVTVSKATADWIAKLPKLNVG